MKENNMMSYEMYEDFKETLVKTIKTELSAKNSQSGSNDLPQLIREVIIQLTERLESIEQSNIKVQVGIDSLQASVESIEIPVELPPRIVQHKISLAIESKGVFWTMIGMMSTIVLLSTMLYWTAKPNYDRIDNDLKYRYIKMKGEAQPDRIAGRNIRVTPRQRKNPTNKKRCRRVRTNHTTQSAVRRTSEAQRMGSRETRQQSGQIERRINLLFLFTTNFVTFVILIFYINGNFYRHTK